MFLNEAVIKFMKSRKLFCAEDTIIHYERMINLFVKFIEMKYGLLSDQIDINDLCKDDLEDYILWLREKPKNENHINRSIQGGKLCNKTIKTYCIDVITFLNWLLNEEYISKSISAKVKLPREDKRSVMPVSQDEVYIMDDMYASTTIYGCRNLALIHGMLDEGMRVKDIANLKMTDIKLDENYIIIRSGKCHKDRILPLSRNFKKYLERYIQLYREENDLDLVFYNNGAPVTRDAVKSIFYRIQKHDGLKRIHAHLLRHTFATSFLCGGGSLEMLRIYMGHSDIATTQKYLHMVNAIQFKPNIYRLDEIFFKKLY